MTSQLDAARHSVADAPQRRRVPSAARVVAVCSGKGGAGTSTVATLLAATLATDGRRILLVDSSARLGMLHHLLGVPAGPPLGALRRGADPGSLVVAVSPTLALISATDDEPLPDADRRALAARLPSLFPAYDLVVLDAGASAATILEACAHGASRLLAVSGGDRIGVAATFALIKLVHQRFAAVRVDVLANRVDDAAAELTHGYVNAATVRFLSRTVHFAGVVPDDTDFGSALAAGLGVHEAAAGSLAAQAMHVIGERMLSEFDAADDAPPTTRTFRMR